MYPFTVASCLHTRHQRGFLSFTSKTKSFCCLVLLQNHQSDICVREITHVSDFKVMSIVLFKNNDGGNFRGTTDSFKSRGPLLQMPILWSKGCCLLGFEYFSQYQYHTALERSRDRLHSKQYVYLFTWSETTNTFFPLQMKCWIHRQTHRQTLDTFIYTMDLMRLFYLCNNCTGKKASSVYV